MEPVFCSRPGKRKKCRRESHCVAQVVWREAGERMTAYFDSITIEKMCRMAQERGIEKQLDHRFMYFI